MKKYKIASLFSGIGGIDLGFLKAGADSIWANEIDPYCAVTFNANHPNINLVVDDICNIKGKDIPAIDILTGGFPCQPFSIAGYRKGFEDERGNMFFQIMRIVNELEENNNKPRIIFLENVKNLKTHDKGNTFVVIKRVLEEHGYIVEEKIMNTSEYGNLPQNRERIFILGFLNAKDQKNFEWPNKINLTTSIEDVVDWNAKVKSKYIYENDKKCYPLLKENINETKTIYQYRRVYVRANKSGVCPTLTANMGMGGHNVPLILNNDGKIRKLLPIECLRLQGFPRNFIVPSELSDSRIYKQVGNAVSVSVIKRVAEKIIEAMRKTDKNADY
ncbi:MAG: DNA cytosine methyltransferase [Tenericutes bacterium]|nr:DNA cytosine methyltransferase [Mycoplasmatota bacterium]